MVSGGVVAGAKVGDVVQFEDKAPAWALGKFVEAGDDAPADHVYVSADVLVVEGPGATLPSVDAVNADLERMRQALSAADAPIAARRKRAAEDPARAD
ncbi:hypothetical protein, partial [Pseudacidovorax intermedius]